MTGSPMSGLSAPYARRPNAPKTGGMRPAWTSIARLAKGRTRKYAAERLGPPPLSIRPSARSAAREPRRSAASRRNRTSSVELFS
jgi:hypothetical protein